MQLQGDGRGGNRLGRWMDEGMRGEMDGRGDQGLDGCMGVGWWLVVDDFVIEGEYS